MAKLEIRPLREDLPFGARVGGVTMGNIADEELRRQLRAVFEDRGLVVFEDIEQSEEMHLTLSDVFGVRKPYAIKDTTLEDSKHQGVISLTSMGPTATITEVEGRQLAGYVSWHFDACYVARLNRAGLLRLTVNAPEDGMTGFADGIQMYNALPAEWQARAEAISVIYHQCNMYDNQRFGLPETWRLLYKAEGVQKLLDSSRKVPRSVHPAVWQRATGEKVLHVSPWQADGIAGDEGAAGDARLADLIARMYAGMQPYWHDWKETDMVLWDNWRFMHSASGYDPQYRRIPLRSTIDGDYGLGCLLEDWKSTADAAA